MGKLPTLFLAVVGLATASHAQQEAITLKLMHNLGAQLRDDSAQVRETALQTSMKHWRAFEEHCMSVMTLSCGASAPWKSVAAALRDWFGGLEHATLGADEEASHPVIRELGRMIESHEDISTFPSCIVTPRDIFKGYAAETLLKLAKSTPDQIKELLGGTDPQLVFAAINSFEANDRKALLPTFRKLLNSEDERIRALGIYGIHLTGGKSASTEIIPFFNDRSEYVRSMAVDCAKLDEPEIKQLLRSIDVQSSARKLSLLEVISATSGDWDEVYFGRLNDPDDEVRAYAAKMLALTKFELIPKAVWDSLLTSSNARARKVGVEHLKQRGVSDADKILEHYLKDPEPSVRAAAISAMGPRCDGLLHSFSMLLNGKLNDELIQALASLIVIADSKASELASRMMSHRSPAVRSAAIKSYALLLHHKPPEEFTHELFSTALRDPAPEVRVRAAYILQQNPMPELLPAISRALADKSVEARAAALGALASLQTVEAWELMAQMIVSKNPQTAELAGAARSGADRMRWFESMSRRYEGLDGSGARVPPP